MQINSKPIYSPKPEWRTDLKSWPKDGRITVIMEVLGKQALNFKISTEETFISVWFQGLPELLNFYRDLGHALDTLQPGLIEPLPDDDPNLVDAMKVVYAADEQRRGVK